MSDDSSFPLISILTPSFNRAGMIETAIQSVLNQNYPKVEHIIMDGGSTDGTIEVLKKYPHLRVISEPDQGMYDAINRGLKIFEGNYICFLNDDDMFPPDVFPKIIEAFSQHHKADAIVGKALVFSQSHERPDYILALDFQRTLLDQFLNGGKLIFNSWFFRRQLFSNIGLLDDRYQIAGDMEFLIRFVLNGSTVWELPDVLYYYRQHSKSKTFSENSTSIINAGNEHLQLIRNYFLEKKIPSQFKPIFRKSAEEVSMRLSIESLKHRNFRSFFKYISTGISYQLLFPIKFVLKSIMIVLNKFNIITSRRV